ncbi:MAG: THUMP domain-containing protein, partial [Clostridia bacterium]
MKNVILLRYGEIHLKGKNRGFFEKMLIDNVEHAMLPFNAVVKRISGRYLISEYKEEDANNIINALKNIAGLYSVSKCCEVISDKQIIYDTAVMMCKNLSGSMKVETNRADKKFPINSMEFSKDLGGYLLDNISGFKVDIHHPEIIINIDIRENGNTYIFTDTEKCIGGLPVGSAGKGLLLLSGGIDSPVAGYMMAKRGV